MYLFVEKLDILKIGQLTKHLDSHHYQQIADLNQFHNIEHCFKSNKIILISCFALDIKRELARVCEERGESTLEFLSAQHVMLSFELLHIGHVRTHQFDGGNFSGSPVSIETQSLQI